MNSVRFHMTYSIELKFLSEYFGQTYLQKHFNYTTLVKYCVMAISRNSNRFLMGIERSLSHKRIMFQFNRSRFIKFFLDIHSERNNSIELLNGYELTYWWNNKSMQLQCGPLFLGFRVNRDSVTWKRANLRMISDSL